MRIPLPKMMRYWREHDYALAKRSELPQRALRYWAWLAQAGRRSIIGPLRPASGCSD